DRLSALPRSRERRALRSGAGAGAPGAAAAAARALPCGGSCPRLLALEAADPAPLPGRLAAALHAGAAARPDPGRLGTQRSRPVTAGDAAAADRGRLPALGRAGRRPGAAALLGLRRGGHL